MTTVCPCSISRDFREALRFLTEEGKEKVKQYRTNQYHERGCDLPKTTRGRTAGADRFLENDRSMEDFRRMILRRDGSMYCLVRYPGQAQALLDFHALPAGGDLSEVSGDGR